MSKAGLIAERADIAFFSAGKRLQQLKAIVAPKIVVVALLVVVLFSTATSSTSQWACAYGVRFCLSPVDKGLIFTLVAQLPVQ